VKRLTIRGAGGTGFPQESAAGFQQLGDEGRTCD
jgi:hypothetical protein